MKSTKINEAEIADLKVAALPTRPNAPAAFGGKGYTATELKAAFDALPLYIIEKFNALIDDVTAEDGIANGIKTGLSDGHTLADLTRDIGSGNFAQYLAVGGRTLEEVLSEMRADIEALKNKT